MRCRSKDLWDVRLLDWIRDHTLGDPKFTSMWPRRNLQRAITDYGWARVLGTGPKSVFRGIGWAIRRILPFKSWWYLLRGSDEV